MKTTLPFLSVLSVSLLLVIAVPAYVFALECFADYPGWQRYVSNSGGLISPPELAISDYDAHQVRYADPRPVYEYATGGVTHCDSDDPLRCAGRIVRGERNPVPLNFQILERGDMGDEVQQLQRCLNVLGYKVAYSGPGSLGRETTYFDRSTEIALMRFQREVRLQETGVVDDATRFFLRYPHAEFAHAFTYQHAHRYILWNQIDGLIEELRELEAREAERERSETTWER